MAYLFLCAYPTCFTNYELRLPNMWHTLHAQILCCTWRITTLQIWVNFQNVPQLIEVGKPLILCVQSHQPWVRSLKLVTLMNGNHWTGYIIVQSYVILTFLLLPFGGSPSNLRLMVKACKWWIGFRFKFDIVHMDSLCKCALSKIHVVHIQTYLFVIMG